MTKRLAVGLLAGLLIAVLALGGCTLDDWAEAGQNFRQAVLKGDAASVRAMSVATKADQIWQALQSRQIDKATDLVVRGAGFSGNFGKYTGYYDFTARMPDASSIPFRAEMVGEGIIFGRWRISAIKFET